MQAMNIKETVCRRGLKILPKRKSVAFILRAHQMLDEQRITNSYFLVGINKDFKLKRANSELNFRTDFAK
jgi:hypothetical protein